MEKAIQVMTVRHESGECIAKIRADKRHDWSVATRCGQNVMPKEEVRISEPTCPACIADLLDSRMSDSERLALSHIVRSRNLTIGSDGCLMGPYGPLVSPATIDVLVRAGLASRDRQSGGTIEPTILGEYWFGFRGSRRKVA